MSEPIQDRRELNEAKKGDGEFFIAGADATMAFNAAEEVFDLVSAPVRAAVESDWPATRAFGREANSGALSAEAGTKGVGVETLVANGAPSPQAAKERLDRVEIVALARGQSNRHRAPMLLDDGCQLGVDAALRASDGLGGLSAAGGSNHLDGA